MLAITNKYELDFFVDFCIYRIFMKIQCVQQGCGSAKILPLPHRLFDLDSNLAKYFCPFPNVD